jgi:hypothetical protein
MAKQSKPKIDKERLLKDMLRYPEAFTTYLETHRDEDVGCSKDPWLCPLATFLKSDSNVVEASVAKPTDNWKPWIATIRLVDDERFSMDLPIWASMLAERVDTLHTGTLTGRQVLALIPDVRS